MNNWKEQCSKFEFQLGDVVVLKTLQGPKMVVCYDPFHFMEGFDEKDNKLIQESVMCSYFDINYNYIKCALQISLLQKVNP